MTNLPTKKQETIFSIIEKSKPQFELAAPKGANVDRNVRALVTLVKSTPALQKCDPASLMSCAMRVMDLGLELNSALSQVYIIPYGQVAQLQISYKGMLALAKRSGEISNVTAREVYSNDVFSFSYGMEDSLIHEPKLTDRGELVAVYAIAKFKDGLSQFEVMSVEEVEKVRATSKMKNSTPWTLHYGEMARKTVIRRLFKYLSISVEMNEAIGLDEQADRGAQDSKRYAEAIPTEGKTLDDELFSDPTAKEENPFAGLEKTGGKE